LGESGNLTAKGRGHISGGGRVGFDGNKGTFMEIDCKTRGGREVIKDFFKIANMLRDRTDNDKSIISILEDRTGKVINKRVEEKAVPRGKKEHLLKHIRHDVKKEGGQRVALPKAAAALDPSTRDAIEKNRGLTRVV
jgi:hypothetical protein